IGMAVGVAIAFMFRHDHGLFLGIGGALTILLAPSPRRGIDLLTFAGATFALLLPYLLYVQVHGGLWLYFRNGVEFSQREASRQWHIWPRVFGDERPLESTLVYELYVLPLVALAILAATSFRRAASVGSGFSRTAGWQATAAWVAPVAVVALLVDFSFIRYPLTMRLAGA